MTSSRLLPQTLHNRYFIMRHGYSIANDNGLIVSLPENGISTAGGPTGEGWALHERGKRQVYESATRLSDYLFPATTTPLLVEPQVVIFCSPFVRTKQTADILHSVLVSTSSLSGTSIPAPEPNIVLRERGYGVYELQSDNNYEICWAEDASETHGENSSSHVESPRSVAERAAGFIKEIESKMQGKTVILVAHGDICQIIQTLFTEGFEPWQHRQLTHVNTADWRQLNSLDA
ncbi:histidine phosphatase superfamily [Umbelopsis sp. PMI_123]|nr:histidine phosphatase superfamily [Umbelopsis sp. PMI_123]